MRATGNAGWQQQVQKEPIQSGATKVTTVVVGVGATCHPSKRYALSKVQV